MVEFIPAGHLKGKYGVFGHFYSVEVAPQQVVECRSVLEIVKTERAPRQTAALSQHKPDAVFIMMNPGSSQPLEEVHHRIQAAAIHELSISLVPTKPDITQYQVMRMMHYCDWAHVRVLNLSDLRCAQSGAFFQQYKLLEEQHAFESHSIFSQLRTAELTRKLTTHPSIPIIRAWGVSPHLDPLIDRCLSTIPRTRVLRGLMKEGVSNKFLHPLPSLQSLQMAWVQRMVEQCTR